MTKLSPKRERFVQEYVIDLNAAAAYRRAGYAAPNAQTASAGAARLLASVSIQARIAEVMQERSQRTKITADRVLQEIALLAFSDIGQIIDFGNTDPHLRPVCTIPESARRSISSMRVKRHVEGTGDESREVEVTEFKLWDKLSALEKAGKHLGMFVDRQEVSGTVTVIRVVEEIVDGDGNPDQNDKAPPSAT